jgi:glycosyltransferase involved in cell wall biosynthesis
MQDNTFSVIIPTHNRAQKVITAIQSVLHQTYPNWEMIIVDDGSDDNTKEVVSRFQMIESSEKKFIPTQVRYIKHSENKERVAAINTGHKYALGDWVAWLGSDDAFTPVYLDTFNTAINLYPEYKMFNCGKLVIHNTSVDEDNFGLRKRKFYDRYGVLEAFRWDKPVQSGCLGAGQFVFKRDLLKKAIPPGGMMPEGRNCYEFADMAKIPGYSSKIRTLGNPWGEDFFMVYKLSKVTKSQPINVPLYIHLVR